MSWNDMNFGVDAEVVLGWSILGLLDKPGKEEENELLDVDPDFLD